MMNEAADRDSQQSTLQISRIACAIEPQIYDKDYSKLENHIKNVQNGWTQSVAKIENLEKGYQRQEEVLKTAQEDCKKFWMMYTNANRELLQQISKLDKIKGELQVSNKKCEELEKIKNYVAELESKVEELQERCNDLERNKNITEGLLKDVQDNSAYSQILYDEVKTQSDLKISKLINKIDLLDGYRSKCLVMQKEKDVLQTTLEQTQGRYTQLQSLYHKSKRDFQKSTNQVSWLKKRIQAIEKELKDCQASCMDYQARCEGAQKSLKQELSRSNRNCSKRQKTHTDSLKKSMKIANCVKLELSNKIEISNLESSKQMVTSSDIFACAVVMPIICVMLSSLFYWLRRSLSHIFVL